MAFVFLQSGYSQTELSSRSDGRRFEGNEWKFFAALDAGLVTRHQMKAKQENQGSCANYGHLQVIQFQCGGAQECQRTCHKHLH